MSIIALISAFLFGITYHIFTNPQCIVVTGEPVAMKKVRIATFTVGMSFFAITALLITANFVLNVASISWEIFYGS
jgi:hypothetical protein